MGLASKPDFERRRGVEENRRKSRCCNNGKSKKKTLKSLRLSDGAAAVRLSVPCIVYSTTDPLLLGYVLVPLALYNYVNGEFAWKL